MDSFRLYFDLGKADALAGKPLDVPCAIQRGDIIAMKAGSEEQAYRMGYAEGKGQFQQIEAEKSRKQQRLF